MKKGIQCPHCKKFIKVKLEGDYSIFIKKCPKCKEHIEIKIKMTTGKVYKKQSNSQELNSRRR